MKEIILKSAYRKTKVSRAAIRKAVAGAFAKNVPSKSRAVALKKTAAKKRTSAKPSKTNSRRAVAA